MPPPQIPDHELLRRIGSGSYGDVWLARNVLGEGRAVKVIYRNRFADPRPFEREFEGIQRFEPISRSHPSQLHILHVGKNDEAGCFYYVMELADSVVSHPCAANTEPGARRADPRSHSSTPTGSWTMDPLFTDYAPHTLRHDLERHSRLPIPDCVQIGLSLATALAHLHEQGLVHRDIKPSNTLFVNGVAKLGDIGLVTEAGDTQSIVGTEGYLPPEGPGTPQADLFSLGKVLYEMSTGMDRRRFAELPDDLREWPDRSAVVEFNEVVLKACAKNPAHRYESAGLLGEDLALLHEGKSVSRARRKQQRWTMVRKAAVGLVLLTLGIAGVVRWAGLFTPNMTSGDGPPSTNALANALCNKALLNLRVDNQREYPEVYTNFYRAIGLDPNFAKPYVGLLEMVVRENMPGVAYSREESLRSTARRLRELAPDSAAAHCGQAVLSFYDLEFQTAEKHARRAISLNPEYEFGHTWYGYMLELWGRPAEARSQLKLAWGLNSSKVQIYRCLGHVCFVERDFPRAIEMYREALGWEPHDLPCYWSMADAYCALGEYRKAVDVLEEGERIQSGRMAPADGHFDRLRQAIAQEGGRGYWEEKWRQTPMEPLYPRARIQAQLGHWETALQLLEEAIRIHRQHEPFADDLTDLLRDEVWDKFRSDTRFQALLEKIGFTKVMASSTRK